MLQHSDLSQPDVRPPGRLLELDGIRGWAALSVVAFHMFYETFGALYPQFRTWPFMVFNGPIAVSVFFVLSGEALSSSYFAGKGTGVVAALAIKRHSRLSIPILGSVLVVYALQKAGLIWSHQAGQIVHRETWLGAFANAPLSAFEVLWFALIGVYQSADADPSMNPFTWTMSVEMMGSFLVFSLVVIWDWLRHPRMILLGLACILLLARPSCYLADFVIGILFAYARHEGLFERHSGTKAAMIATTILLPTIVAAEVWGFQTLPRSENIIAPILLAAIYFNGPLMAFFASRVSRWLGSISFSLYLIQFPILISLTSFLIARADAAHSLNAATASLIGTGSIAASIIAAVIFEPVEILTKQFGRKLARALISQSPRANRPMSANYREQQEGYARRPADYRLSGSAIAVPVSEPR